MRSVLLLAALIAGVLATQCVVAVKEEGYYSTPYKPSDKTYISTLELENGTALSPVVAIPTLGGYASTSQFMKNASQIVIYAEYNGVYYANVYNTLTGDFIMTVSLGQTSMQGGSSGQMIVLPGQIFCFSVILAQEANGNSITTLFCNNTDGSFRVVWTQPNGTASFIAPINGTKSPIVVIVTFKLPSGGADGEFPPPLVTSMTVQIFNVVSKKVLSTAVIDGIEYWGYSNDPQYLLQDTFAMLHITNETTGAALFGVVAQSGGTSSGTSGSGSNSNTGSGSGSSGDGENGAKFGRSRGLAPAASGSTSASATSSQPTSTTSSSGSIYKTANDQVLFYEVASIYKNGTASPLGSVTVGAGLDAVYFYYTGTEYIVIGGSFHASVFMIYRWSNGVTTGYGPFNDPQYTSLPIYCCHPHSIYCY